VWWGAMALVVNVTRSQTYFPFRRWFRREGWGRCLKNSARPHAAWETKVQVLPGGCHGII